jgi:hypothetical protein
MKGREIRFMLVGAPATRRELQELLYKSEKDVGRFPEWHVPGIGNHDMLRVRKEGDELWDVSTGRGSSAP